MHPTTHPLAITIGLLVVTNAVTALPQNQVEFSTPAQVAGNLEVTGVTWVLFLLGSAGNGTISMETPAGTITETSRDQVEVDTVQGRIPRGHDNPEGQSSSFTSASIQALFQGPYGSLLLQGKNLTIRTPTGLNLGSNQGATMCTHSILSSDTIDEFEARPHCFGDSVFGWHTGNANQHVTLVGSVDELEWHNALPTCPPSTTNCPTGGPRTTETEEVFGNTLRRSHFTYERLRFTEPSAIDAKILAPMVLFGGPSITTQSDQIRLPGAQGSACSFCGPEPSTLWMNGTIILRDVRPHSQSTLQASLGGRIESARLDELQIPPEVLGFGAAASVAGIAGLLLLAKYAIAPLFTRLSKQEALEHPKRQKIYQYIQEHPGANFREVARNTSIAAGTVRHHLTVLERAGHVVEHPHQGTVRLFENHGKFDHNWSDLVLLREPPLAKLHEWLKQHPGSPQKAALEAMEKEGWSRSTTQHRLSRLVEGGVATIRLQGRLKIYSVVDRQAPKPAFGQLVSLRPAYAS